MVAKRLRIKGMHLCPIEDKIYSLIGNAFSPFRKHPDNEVGIDFPIDFFEIETACALVKRASCIRKHFRHQMFLTATKHKLHIFQGLDVRAQQSFHVVSVFPDLLKFIDGNDGLTFPFLNEFKY